MTSLPREGVLLPETLARLEFEQDHPIRVGARLSRPHPLTRMTRDGFARPQIERTEYADVLSPGSEGAASIHVTGHQVPRALRILDALIVAAELRGHPVVVESGPGTERGTFLRVGEWMFELSIRERQHQIEIEPSELERLMKPGGLTPTELRVFGLLYIDIKRHRHGWPHRQIRETRELPLEHRLNELFCSIYRMVDECDRFAAEELESAAAWESRQQRVAEEERRTAEDRARADELFDLVDRWSRSEKIREFIEVFRQRSRLPTDELEAQVRWMTEQAKRLDPFS